MGKTTRNLSRGKMIYLIWYTCDKCSWTLLTEARTYTCSGCKGNRLTHKTVSAVVLTVETK